MSSQVADGYGLRRGRRPSEEHEMNEETWARIQRQNEGALRETPDDTMFRWLAMSYAHSHLTMTETYRGSCHTDDVTGGQGIINRASWKPVVGSKCQHREAGSSRKGPFMKKGGRWCIRGS